MKINKKIIGLSACLLLVSGCGKVPKLKDGKDAVVSFDKKMISVDDLYTKMKDTYALNTLITMVDTYVLETTFKDYIDEAKEYAESYINALRENYKSDEEFAQQLYYYTGMSSIEDYQESLYLNYMQSHATEEYAKSEVTDKQVKKYYDEEAVGDIEVSHILITPDVKDDMTEDEVKEKENEAKEKAEKIIKTLNETKKDELEAKFKELAKKSSKDDATKENGGSLGKINKDSLGTTYTDLVDAAYELKDGAYSKKVIKTELGYHVILKTKSYKKESLDKLKDKIIEKLAQQAMQEDASLVITALQHYRKELGMKIEDDKLKTQYANYIQNSLMQAKEQNK